MIPSTHATAIAQEMYVHIRVLLDSDRSCLAAVLIHKRYHSFHKHLPSTVTKYGCVSQG